MDQDQLAGSCAGPRKMQGKAMKRMQNRAGQRPSSNASPRRRAGEGSWLTVQFFFRVRPRLTIDRACLPYDRDMLGGTWWRAAFNDAVAPRRRDDPAKNGSLHNGLPPPARRPDSPQEMAVFCRVDRPAGGRNRPTPCQSTRTWPLVVTGGGCTPFQASLPPAAGSGPKIAAQRYRLFTCCSTIGPWRIRARPRPCWPPGGNRVRTLRAPAIRLTRTSAGETPAQFQKKRDAILLCVVEVRPAPTSWAVGAIAWCVLAGNVFVLFLGRLGSPAWTASGPRRENPDDRARRAGSAACAVVARS